MRRFHRSTAGALLLAVSLLALIFPPCAAAQSSAPALTPSVRVLAAADLQFALTDIATRYQQETGTPVSVSFGSSGNLSQQIRQGLPADLFMSADESFVLQLAQSGMTRAMPAGPDQGVLYAIGRLALVVPKDSPIPLDAQLQGLVSRWSQVEKFAIANPEHAPYGRAAQEALQSLHLWSLVQQRLVTGENITQTHQFVVTGAAQAGISALSLVQAPEMQGRLRYVVLPQSLHLPLYQRMVLLKGASPDGQAFYRYLQRADIRQALARYGFEAPP